MKPIRWNSDKSLSLKAERGVSFEEVLSAISQGGLLSVMDHPNRAKYGHQKMLVVGYETTRISFLTLKARTRFF